MAIYSYTGPIFYEKKCALLWEGEEEGGREVLKRIDNFRVQSHSVTINSLYVWTVPLLGWLLFHFLMMHLVLCWSVFNSLSARVRRIFPFFFKALYLPQNCTISQRASTRSSSANEKARKEFNSRCFSASWSPVERVLIKVSSSQLSCLKPLSPFHSSLLFLFSLRPHCEEIS